MSSTRLLINGLDADLPTDFSLNLVLNNPLFETQQQGSMSFPFTLRATPSNISLFINANLLQSASARVQKYPAQFLSGPFRIEGIFELRNYTQDSYLGYLVVPPGNIQSEVWDTLLTKLQLGTEAKTTEHVVSNLFSAKIQKCVEGTTTPISTYKYILEVNSADVATYTLDYVGNPDPILTESVVNTLFATYLNENNADTLKAYATDDSLAVYFYTAPSLVKLKQQIVGLPNINKSSTLTRLEYDRPAPFPNATTTNTPTNSKYFFPEILNKGFYDKDRNPAWNGLVNKYANSEFKFNSGVNATQYSITPMIWLSWFIGKFCELTAYRPEGPFLDDTELAKLLIYNTYSLDKQLPGTNIPYNIYDNVIKYANHLPQISVKDAFDALRNYFALGIIWNSTTRSVEFLFMKDIMNSAEIEDWTDKTAVNYQLAHEDPKHYQLSSSLDSADQYTSTKDPITKQPLSIFDSYPTAQTVEESEIEYTRIESKISSLTKENITDGPTTLYTIPAANQQGISVLFEQQANSFGFRLLFGNGMVNDTTGAPHPTASNESTSYLLSWGGEKGLYEQFWKDYIAFLQRTYEVEFPITLTELDLANLDWKRKKYIQGNAYFVRQITATFDRNGLSKRPTAKFWKA